MDKECTRARCYGGQRARVDTFRVEGQGYGKLAEGSSGDWEEPFGGSLGQEGLCIIVVGVE